MRIFIPILFSLILGIFSCRVQEKIPESYIDRFYRNNEQITEVIKLLSADSTLIGKSGEIFGANKFSNSISKKLQSLGIDTVYCFSWDRTQRQFDLKTNWRKENPIHLTHNTLDTITTVKGFYRKDENSNEMWGLGDSWTLWIERKLLDRDS